MTAPYKDNNNINTCQKKDVNNCFTPVKRFEVALIAKGRRDLYVILNKKEFKEMNKFLAEHEFEMPKDRDSFKHLCPKVRKILFNWLQMRE